MWSLFAVALANSDGNPVLMGWDSPADVGVPTDVVLSYNANFQPRFAAERDDGRVEELDVDWTFEPGGGRYRVLVHPPPGGWGAGRTWTVTVDGTPADLPRRTDPLTFVTGAHRAAPAGDLRIEGAELGPWSEPVPYPYGCCHPIRTLDLQVDAATGGTFGWIEVEALDPDPGAGWLRRFGDGPLGVPLFQWQDGAIAPECFRLTAISAAGVPAGSDEICADEKGVRGGCGSGGLAGVALVAALPLTRRARARRG